MGVKTAPSLLASDFAHLAEEVKRAEAAGADMLHLDVMDGHFVPNLTIGPALVKSIRPHTRLPFDVHLMVDNAHDFFEPFAEAGADALNIHLEVYPEPEEMLDRIGALGRERGLTINPDMPVERLEGHLDKVDRLLLMSVFPGFGGQSFIEDTYERLRRARELVGDRPIEIQVDGGINTENAPAVIEAGAQCLVAGTSTFRADDMGAVLRQLRGEG
jgi:ribulose-phosphate 3-epimerase